MIAASCNPGLVFMLIIIVAGGVYILADARSGGPGGGLFGPAKPKRPMWWTEMSEASPRTLRAEIERITPLADAGNVAAIRYRVELRRYFE